MVNGTMTATGTTFKLAGGGDNAQIVVNGPAGHLVATGGTFAWDDPALAGGSVLNRGDLAGDTFNQTISVPITDVPLLAGNLVFQTIDINPGTLASGTIELTNAIASSPSPKLVYVLTRRLRGAVGRNAGRGQPASTSRLGLQCVPHGRRQGS